MVYCLLQCLVMESLEIPYGISEFHVKFGNSMRNRLTWPYTRRKITRVIIAQIENAKLLTLRIGHERKSNEYFKYHLIKMDVKKFNWVHSISTNYLQVYPDGINQKVAISWNSGTFFFKSLTARYWWIKVLFSQTNELYDYWLGRQKIIRIFCQWVCN